MLNVPVSLIIEIEALLLRCLHYEKQKQEYLFDVHATCNIQRPLSIPWVSKGDTVFFFRTTYEMAHF